MRYLVLVLFIAAGSSAAAQSETPIRDSVEKAIDATNGGHQIGFEKTSVNQTKKERFFGPTNLLLGTAIFASAAADIETTLGCIGKTGTSVIQLPGGGTYTEIRSCAEGPNLMRPFVNGGRWTAYGGKAIVDVPLWVGSYYMRRSRHKGVKIAGWALPFMATGIQLRLAYNNTRELAWVRNGHY